MLPDSRDARIKMLEEALGWSSKLWPKANDEADRARKIFPTEKNHTTLALAEEAGEVVQAAMNYYHGTGTMEKLEKEIVQCVAMCIRLWEDGDVSIDLPPVEKRA